MVVWFAIFSFFSTLTWARTPDESEFLAADLTGEDVAIWFQGLSKKPASVGIFSSRANPPMEQDYAGLVEAQVVKNLRTSGATTVVTCPECRTPQVTTREDRIVVTRGAPDTDSFRQIGKKLNVESFLTLEIFRTKLSVITQATLYQTSNGEVIASERFKVPAVSFSDAAMQVVLTVGPGLVFPGRTTAVSEVPIAANLMILEEMGFGKGGLNLGTIYGHLNGTMAYILPTLGFRGRFGATSLTHLTNIGLGFGFSGDTKGLAGRAAFDVFIGSFTLVGLEATYLVPMKGNPSIFRGFVGGHIGISLGR